ncbi:YaeQ family protein [soil metagenome]
MALSATMRKFAINLADSDRGVYELLEWRVAQHPSENVRFLAARVLARVLEHAEGVDFSKDGLSDEDEPALHQKNLRGEWQAWIEVGSPTPDRLHKAAKKAPRVVVYAWRNVQALADAIRERKVHKMDELKLVSLDEATLDEIGAKLDRQNTWELAVSGGTIYLTAGDSTFELTPEQIPL